MNYINEQNRSICVLYLTATCNLKCRYCYIDKSPALQSIDKILVDSYKTDYYINFMKEMFPHPNQLKEIQMWGGEPSYGLPRVAKTIKDAIDYYPQLFKFMMSTNLTTPSFIDDFFGFLQIFQDYPNRHFEFDLQLSLDGPTYINENNRGIGTTKLFTENFFKLISQIDGILKTMPNVSVFAHFKPTLDESCLDLLQSKERVINYYKFFDNFKNAQEKITDSLRFDLCLPAPNMAVPGTYTVDICKKFGNFCKLCTEIYIENPNKHWLKYDRILTPYVTLNRSTNFDDPHFKCLNEGSNTCGTGNIILGLLPNDLVSACHNGFCDLLTDYKEKSKDHIHDVNRTIDFRMFLDQDISNKSTYTKKEYYTYEKQMNCFTCKSKFQIVELASLIQLYADAGQVDKQYSDPKEAVIAAHFIADRVSLCVRDNIGVTGSRYLNPTSYLKLFLNGAKEAIKDAECELSRRAKSSS